MADETQVEPDPASVDQHQIVGTGPNGGAMVQPSWGGPPIEIAMDKLSPESQSQFATKPTANPQSLGDFAGGVGKGLVHSAAAGAFPVATGLFDMAQAAAAPDTSETTPITPEGGEKTPTPNINFAPVGGGAQDKFPELPKFGGGGGNFNEDIQAINQGIEAQQTAGTNLGQIEADRFKRNGEILGAKTDLQTKRAAFLANNADQIQKDSNDFEQKYEKASAEIKDVDPNHYWASKNTGEKILAGVGLALSGFASGVTGQANVAVQIIDNAIRRDIEAQQANIGKQQRGLQNMQVLQSVRRQGVQDVQMQNSLAYGVAVDQVENQLAQTAAQSGSKEAVQRAAQLKGQLDTLKAQERLKAHGMIVDNSMKQTQMGLQKYQLQVQQYMLKHGGMGNPAVSEISNATNAIDELSNNVDKISGVTNLLGPGISTNAAKVKDQLDAIGTHAANALKTMYGGRIPEAANKQIEDFKNMGTWNPKLVKTKLAGLRQFLQNESQTTANLNPMKGQSVAPEGAGFSSAE